MNRCVNEIPLILSYLRYDQRLEEARQEVAVAFLARPVSWRVRWRAS